MIAAFDAAEVPFAIVILDREAIPGGVPSMSLLFNLIWHKLNDKQHRAVSRFALRSPAPHCEDSLSLLYAFAAHITVGELYALELLGEGSVELGVLVATGEEFDEEVALFLHGLGEELAEFGERMG